MIIIPRIVIKRPIHSLTLLPLTVTQLHVTVQSVIATSPSLTALIFPSSKINGLSSHILDYSSAPLTFIVLPCGDNDDGFNVENQLESISISVSSGSVLIFGSNSLPINDRWGTRDRFLTIAVGSGVLGNFCEGRNFLPSPPALSPSVKAV
ncbi:hypothetical protein PIB30_027937 [Stylosanthes scabra]|uniref:Uncharacterized protein n=1 Tax=Stylosanthes scabra TaxID=79078 RepID=A0ABU6SBL1_9FABA|nr:hypothetical protein [Stylosanthes scabra]